MSDHTSGESRSERDDKPESLEHEAGTEHESVPGDGASESQVSSDRASSEALSTPPPDPLADPPATPEPPRTSPPEAASEVIQPPPASRSGGGRAIAVLALLLALGAAGLAGLAWWTQRNNTAQITAAMAAFDDARSAIQSGLGAVKAVADDLEGVSGSVDRVSGRVQDIDTRQSALGDQVASQINRLAGEVETATRTVQQVERAVTDAGGVVSRARDDWVIAETEYLLQTANTALQMARDPDAALAALLAADDRLRGLADPTLTATRQAVSNEIAAIRAMSRPDIQGVALTLGSLAARVELLPLAGGPDTRYGRGGGDVEGESGFARALAAVKDAFKSMVSVQRNGEDIAPLLAPNERFFLYRNLELQIESARLAALRADSANYAQSLAAAQRWLEQRFEVEDSGVQSALATLADLEKTNVDPSAPDISASLRELRTRAGAAR